jgi:hypothetical protein
MNLHWWNYEMQIFSLVDNIVSQLLDIVQ